MAAIKKAARKGDVSADESSASGEAEARGVAARHDKHTCAQEESDESEDSEPDEKPTSRKVRARSHCNIAKPQQTKGNKIVDEDDEGEVAGAHVLHACAAEWLQQPSRSAPSGRWTATRIDACLEVHFRMLPLLLLVGTAAAAICRQNSGRPCTGAMRVLLARGSWAGLFS